MGSCRCKMCGGHIHYDKDASVATCEFCGTEQTIVKTDDTKKVNLFNRANALRLQNEFDKAQLTYDNILIDEPNNAEAHWGICLCRYGIEYVTVEGKKVPTCHRTSIRSIFDDLDYKEAIDNADVVAKGVYEKEAKVIDKIQKDTLLISQKEEPYDVFLSYNETDNNARTKDSYKAEAISKELEKNGYRVFSSRECLKTVEVTKIQPVIFAALMSSKVMLSIGSSKNQFYSTWEKNEWSRFMSMMQDNRNKFLIPCYFDMDSNDLPEEFMMFQAQDVSNNLDSLVKRIDKLFTTSEKVVVTSEQVEVREKVVNKLSVENNLGRIGLFLADGKFTKVNQLSEDVLNTDYTCALAYYYKMLASYGCRNEEDIIKNRIVLDNDKNCEKALKFADQDLKNKINDINEKVREAILAKEKAELIKKIDYYLSNKKYSDALEQIPNLLKYKDSNEEAIRIKDEIYNSGVKKSDEKRYDEAISILSLLGDYRNSIPLITEMKHEIRVNEEIKQCKKLCESVDNIMKRMDNTKVYDDKSIKSIYSKLEEIKGLELCPTSMDSYYAFKERLKHFEEKRAHSKFVAKVVGFILLGVAIVIIISAVICLTVFMKK